MPSNDRCRKVIANLVTVMDDKLADVRKGLTETNAYISKGESENAVIGTLMTIEAPLEQLQTLYKSAMAIHRLPGFRE